MVFAKDSFAIDISFKIILTGNAAIIANWRDVLAIYAVRTTTDDTSPDEVATLTAEKLDILR